MVLGSIWAIASATNWSLSRDPVPLPMAINSTRYCLHKLTNVRCDLSQLFWGACGNIVLVCNNLPVPSTTASLQPVRKPGSKPSVTFSPAGAAISKSFKLDAKTAIESVSARSRNCPSNSVSRVAFSLLCQLLCTICAKNLAAVCCDRRKL